MDHALSETPWTRYLRLMEERPAAFAESPLLPIVTDPELVREFTARTGREIGVLYESPYRMLVVDLVRGPEGLFAYERILPVSQGASVVAVPVWEGRLVLLEQFRHALRRCQIAFPRGFGEDGLSAEENARKEVREELRSEVLSQCPLGLMEADSGLTGGTAHVILCQVTEPKPELQYEEIQGVVCLTPAELEREIAAGRIRDGFTLSAWALCRAAGEDLLCRFGACL